MMDNVIKTESIAKYLELRRLDSNSIRQTIRSESYTGHTAGLAAGNLQANVVILPEKHALDFMRFCHRNPKPCPISGISDTGNPEMFTLGSDIDIRTDVPEYYIYHDGELNHTRYNITDIWSPDLVAFALGCSFTFEHAAERAGVKFWHIQNNTVVSMYKTNISCIPAGCFSGNMVVSMRPVAENQVGMVTEISAKYPQAHGAPVHIGNPTEIGIEDITKPQWGDPSPILEGQIPVFWACGVTPQLVLRQARLPLVITHKPGCMLITDIDECAGQ